MAGARQKRKATADGAIPKKKKKVADVHKAASKIARAAKSAAQPRTLPDGKKTEDEGHEQKITRAHKVAYYQSSERWSYVCIADSTKKSVLSHQPRTTRATTTAAARDAVFNTAELLENIMLQLPNQTGIACQRVCHQFNDLVQTSTNIQKKLFLRLAEDKGAETWKRMPNDNHSVPRAHAMYRTDGPPDVAQNDLYTRNRNFAVPSFHNPLFERSHAQDQEYGGLHGGSYLLAAMQQTLQGRSLPMRMHFASSAVICVRITTSWKIGAVHGYTSALLQDPSGCTVGMALQAITQRPPEEIIGTKTTKISTGDVVDEISARRRKAVCVTRVSIQLFGMLLPTDKQREACLPLA